MNADQQRLKARRRYLAWRRRILPTLTILLLLAAWEGVIRYFDIPYYFAPAPSDVAASLIANALLLLRNLVPTAIEAVLGFSIGNLIAISVAIAFVYARTVDIAFFPIAVMLNTIPVVAVAPILVLLFGDGLGPKVAVAALVCFFPMLVNATRGLRGLSRLQYELMHVLSASPREIFLKVRVYNALPYFFAGLKITAIGSVVGALVGEWVGAKEGLGALIVQTTLEMDTHLLYAALVFSALLSAAFFSIVSLLETHMLRWKAGRDG